MSVCTRPDMQAMLDQCCTIFGECEESIKQVISKLKVSAKPSLTDSLISKDHYFLYTKEKKQVGTFSEYSATSSNIVCMSAVHQFSVFVHHHLPFYTHPQQAAIVNAIFIPIIMSTQHKHETNNLLPTVSIIYDF